MVRKDGKKLDIEWELIFVRSSHKTLDKLQLTNVNPSVSFSVRV